MPGVTHYQVWRATGPYFAPLAATPIATVTSPTYTDPGRIGDPTVNYFYALAAVNRCSQGSSASAASAEVGEFDFGMIPGQ